MASYLSEYDLDEEKARRSIVVSNIPEYLSYVDVKIHFQREGNGGGEVDSTKYPDPQDHSTVVITFDEPATVETVIGCEHRLGDNDVIVQRYPVPEVIPQVFQFVQARVNPSIFSSSGILCNVLEFLQSDYGVECRKRKGSNAFYLIGSFQQITQCHEYILDRISRQHQDTIELATERERHTAPEKPRSEEIKTEVFEVVQVKVNTSIFSSFDTLCNVLEFLQSDYGVESEKSGRNNIFYLTGTFQQIIQCHEYILDRISRQQQDTIELATATEERTCTQLLAELQQKIERRLATEQQNRQTAENMRQVTERRANELQGRCDELQASLTSEQRISNELQASLAEVQQTNQRIQRELSSEQENRQQMEREFALEQQARQEIERRLATEQQNRQTTEDMLQEAEQRANELQGRCDVLQASLTSEQRISNELQASLAEVQQTNQRIQRELSSEQENRQQMETRFALEQQARQEIERRLATEQQNRQSTENMLQVAEQRANELQGRCDELVLQQSRDWILARDEAALPDRPRIIGRGAWGEVIEGTFRGCTVAVKRIHELILSDHNRRLFEREMNMASRCRHPCLLQFIGATADDAASPLFVTELLETSLRAVLPGRALEPVEILTIALDVARGLNYLHLNRPDPIIHRDISSGNVLLWRQNNSWRAKVSDYGTANFIRRCATVSPGAPIYSAPEAIDFTQQTTKIDVYSFGVLLCEMHIREQPDPLERNSQVSRVSNRCHRTLIQRCLQPNPDDRPSMGEVIDILERSRDDPLSINETS